MENQTSYEGTQKNLITRLNRIEGQVRGIKKMVEENRDCAKILEQVSSLRSALDSVGLIFVSCALYKQISEQVEKGHKQDFVITETMKPFLKRTFEEK